MTRTSLAPPLAAATRAWPPLQGGGGLDFSELAIWSLVLLGCLAAGTLVIRAFRSSARRAERGEEFTALGLKGLYERGVMTEEEYRAVKKKMAERITQQIREEEQRRAEAGKPALPAEIALAREAETVQRSAPGPKSDSLSDLDLKPPSAPEPLAEGGALTDEEIARLQREELERKRRIAERSRGEAPENG